MPRKPTGKPNGRPFKMPKQSPAELADKFADRLLAGEFTGPAVQKDAGVGEKTAEKIVWAGKMELAEYQEAFRLKAQSLVMSAVERLSNRIDEATIGQLTMIGGVFQDKIAAQRQGPASVHLHLHGKDRDSVLKTVLGRDTERIGSAAPAPRPNTGPTIEAELVTPPVSTPDTSDSPAQGTSNPLPKA